MNRIIIILIFALACFVIFSCSLQLYMPASTDAVKQNELLRGRKLYVNHCGGCHNLHLPKEYTASQWEKNMDEMQDRAKITDGEKQLIFEFLTFQH